MQSHYCFLNQQHILSTISDLNRKREFTLFEKLIESTLSPVWLHAPRHEQTEGLASLQRAENIVKLLSIPEAEKNGLHYQYLLYLLDQEMYTITEYELIYQVEQFREEHNLLKGDDF